MVAAGGTKLLLLLLLLALLRLQVLQVLLLLLVLLSRLPQSAAGCPSATCTVDTAAATSTDCPGACGVVA